LWPTIQKQLDAARVEYQAYETKSPGDATIQTRAALNSGVEIIVVVGGDGTLSEAAEGFSNSTMTSMFCRPRSIHLQHSAFFLPVRGTTSLAGSTVVARLSQSGWRQSSLFFVAKGARVASTFFTVAAMVLKSRSFV
jgi:hypothetical protein